MVEFTVPVAVVLPNSVNVSVIVSNVAFVFGWWLPWAVQLTLP